MKKFTLFILILIGVNYNTFSQYSQVESYTGEIRLFAGNFAPTGWALCDGQSISIQQNQALFSILGTTYGGDGKTTFSLPDLRSRIPIHVGYSTPTDNLTKITLGEKDGVEKNFIKPSTTTIRTEGVSLDTHITGKDGAPSVVTSVSLQSTGELQSIDNRQPYIGVNYIICLYGIYPMRY
jgi:microcystin-dependent protein